MTDKYGNTQLVRARVVFDNGLCDFAESTTLEIPEGKTATLTAGASARVPNSIIYKWYDDSGNLLQESADNTFVTPAVTKNMYYTCCYSDIFKNDVPYDYTHFEIIRTDPVSDITEADVTVSAEGLTYNGEAQEPAVTVKYDGKELAAGTDYEVKYENNIDAGTDTAAVTITGIGGYKGTVEKTFSIARAAQTLEAEDLTVTFSGKKTVSVTGAQGKVTYTSGSTSIATVDAEGNVTGKAVGTAEIIISAAGNSNYLPAETKITVTVQAATIQAKHVSVSAGSFTYNGKEKKPSVTVKYGSKTLTAGTDYKVTYKNNINAGTNTAQVIVTGQGNYKGTVNNKFSIAKASQKLTVKAVKAAVGKTATISVTGAKGTKSFKTANKAIATVTSKGVVTGKKVGTVKITVTSKATSNYKAASKTVAVKVVPAATKKITAANLATGIKLTWTKVAGANGYLVYCGSTKIATIKSGSTVTYTDKKANTNGSKYTYKIVAKASSGTSTLSKSLTTYRVTRPAVKSLANSAKSKMTVKWAKNAKATGYQVQYATDSKFKTGLKTVTIKKAATVSTVISKLTRNKTYYVRMRTCKKVGKVTYYSAWSAAKSLKIKK